MPKSGFKNTQHLSHRIKEQRGGKARQQLLFDRSESGNMADYSDEFIDWLEVKGYTTETMKTRRYCLDLFLQWSYDRDLIRASDITKAILESYLRYLSRFRKKNDKALGYSTQCSRIIAVREFFKWLCRSNYILYNPASELDLPRRQKRLPEQALSIEEMELILCQPDLNDLLGIRDRTILEVLYSSGLRRSELIRLELTDLNVERKTIYVRQGKGQKDRIVPVGERALAWLERYLNDVRSELIVNMNERTLFLSGYGEGFNADVLSRKVTKYIKNADIGRTGSCHLLRHTCATHMLEGGADIRYIQQLLGHEKLETTQIYTEVSIKQLQLVHAQTHPAKLKERES